MNSSLRLSSTVTRFFFAGFLSAASIISAHANEADRLQNLERELQEIKARLSALERPAVTTKPAQAPAQSGDGWKVVSNWRRLKEGMGYDEVRNILGEPERVNGGDVAIWRYANRGEAGFFLGKLNRWSEPR